MSDEVKNSTIVEQEQAPDTQATQAPKVEKKKLKLGDVAKCTLALTIIALVAGLLLGIVNWATYVDPDSVIMDKALQYFNATSIEKDDELASYDFDKSNYVERCFVALDESNERIGYCYYTVGGGAKDGSMELLVYIDKNNTIVEIECYEQGETAGYFDKVEKASKSKYVGLNVAELSGLSLVKNKSELAAGEVNSVSSATYTSTGYHNAIAAAVYAHRTAIDKAATGGEV